VAATVSLVLAGFLAIGGFFLVGWKALYEAQRQRRLVTTGVYSYVRHPQYVGFILVMFGFLLQWPTLLTLAMFPVLVFMYVRLAHGEERTALAEFGEQYAKYVREVPGFIPRLSVLLSGPRRQWDDDDPHHRSRSIAPSMVLVAFFSWSHRAVPQTKRARTRSLDEASGRGG
jgi:uncharacterized membrane protein